MSRPYSQLTPAFALLALAACERSTADMIDEARKAADRNPPDVLHAKRLLDDVLERTANDVSPSTLSQRRMALLIRGDVFRTIGLLSAAESDFRSILEQIDPADAEILIRIATVLAERADDSLGDLDRAIRYAEKAALVTTDSSAQIAAGVAHYKRGAHKRLKLTQDLLAVIGAANAKQVLASVRDSMSVGESDPVAVASDRLLDKILEFKTVDTRVRVTDAIADVRADLRLARDFLFKAVEPLSREDSLTFEHILPLLSDTHDLESSLWIARLLLRDRNYWENPRIVDACASAIADSNAYAEAADVLRDYIERGPFEMMYSSKSLALRLAMESNNGGVLKSVVEAIRKKLKRDPNAKLVSRLLVMYDSVLDRIEGKDHKTVATALAAFISKRDPEFADLIAPAAILAAKEYLAVDMHAEALRMVEIGVSSDEENVELNAMRASLLCKLKGEPVTAGRNARNAIVRDPANVERYLPSLRQAAEMFLAKTGQSLSRVEEDAIVRGEGLPKGYSEGWLYYVFARDYLDLGNRSAAASCALEAIARDAEMTPALVVFGLAASGNGQLAEARDAFLRALDAMPADPGLLRRVCDSGAAPAETTLLLLSARPEVEGRVLLAESLFDRCDREHAIRVIEQVAMQASANDDALLSAARSLIEDSRKSSLDTAAAEVGKTLLRRVSQDPKSATLAAQASLELALLRGEDVKNKETLVAIKRGREWVDEKSLLLTVDAAARRGYAKTAVEVLRPLAEIVSPAMRAAFLHRLGSFEYLTGNYKNAASAFDRQIAIEERYENSIFLALCLLRDGDLTGAREALNQLRADWGITPMDSRRAMLALLLQTELSPEEKMALKHMGKTPLEVLQLASLLRIHPLVAGDAAPLSNVAWSRSAAEFASKSPNVASALLRFSLALSTRNGEFMALSELNALRAEVGAHPMIEYLEAQWVAHEEGQRARAAELYESCARKIPSLADAWSRAADLYLAIGRADRALIVLKDWCAADPSSTVAAFRLKIAEITSSKSVAAHPGAAVEELLKLQKADPDSLELAAALLRARLAAGKSTDTVVAARRLFELCKSDPALLGAFAEPLCGAYIEQAADIPGEAFEFASALRLRLPHSRDPVLLLAACHQAAQRYSDATDEIIEYLSGQGRDTALDAAAIRQFVNLVASHDPVGAAEIAKIALAANISDWQLWELFVTTHAAIGRSANVVRYLDAFYSIEGTPATRLLLASLLASPEQNAARALELLKDVTASGPPADASAVATIEAKARALRILNRCDEAVALLEKAIGPMNAVPFRARIENWESYIPQSYKNPLVAPLVYEMAMALGNRAQAGDVDAAFCCFKQSAIALKGPVAARADALSKVAHHMRVFLRIQPPSSEPQASRPGAPR